MSLELRDISFSSEKETYIYPTNLLLKGGSLNILLGPTLSGKTSLMRLMVGLDPPDNGNIFWNGENVTRKSVRKRNVAMVYQQFINYPSLSVYENIASPLRLLKTPTSEIDQKVKSVAELMKLSKLLDRKPLELSGGQQQRVALARALVKEADLVLLDEPLANLDYKLREELRSEIPQIFSETGSVFVYATTEASDALLLGGNTACLHEGKIVQYDETLKLYHHPVNLAAARVFSDPPLNILPVIRTDEALQIGDNLSVSLNDYVRKISNGRYFLAFRPIKLSPYKNPEKKDIIEFKGVVDVAEITGSETIIHLKFGQESLVSMVHGVYKTQINQALSFYLDLKNAYIFDPEEKLVLSPEILQEREHGYNPS